jgi:nitrite reductase (NADH) large subunit
MQKIIIIGGGIAGLTAAENARGKDPDAEILIISEEDYVPYSRMKLSKYIYAPINEKNLYIHNKKWYEDKNIELLLSTSVTKINVKQNSITLKSGKELNYTNLILANGSSSFVPPFTGANKNGVFTVRKIKDLLSIQDYIDKNSAKNLVVIGGGLLGIEAAWALRQANNEFNITIIENMPRLLPRQLDEEGSVIVADILRKNNMNLQIGSSVKEIAGQDKVEYVSLDNGDKIDADLIIVSAGVRSNLTLAKECGINTNRGILVDENMKTNLDNIYAAGDVAEFNGMVWGIWPVATEQGKIAGLNSVGENTAYKEITPSNLLQVTDIKVFSAGDITGVDCKPIKYQNSIYTKLFFKQGLLCGCILIGDTKKGLALKNAIEQKRDFSKSLENNDNILNVL